MILIHHDSPDYLEEGYPEHFEEHESSPILNTLNREFETLISPRASLPAIIEEMDDSMEAMFYLK